MKNECVEKEIEAVHPKFTKLLTDILVREGDVAVLECEVEGYPKPSIKWFLNTTEIKYSDRVEVNFVEWRLIIRENFNQS